MKLELECFPCVLEQTINYIRAFVNDQKLQTEIMNGVLKLLYKSALDVTPPELGKQVYQFIGEITGNKDPFKEIRHKDNQKILKMYQELKSIICNNPDPIKTAAKLAIAGNVIDYGANHGVIGLEMLSNQINQVDLAVNHLAEFLKDLDSVEHVLYLADNAGEIVLDKLFIEMIRQFHTSNSFAITVVVRGEPVINDAVKDDATYIGMDKYAIIIDNGDSAPGTILKNCSLEMQKYFKDADLIISKGQGNYETLSDETQRIYFLLQAKCPLIARHLGVNQGDLVLKKTSAGSQRF